MPRFMSGVFLLAPAVGLEPTTNRLTADCSTTELRWNNLVFFGGRYRNRTSIKGFAVLCISHSANRPVFQDKTSFTLFFIIRQGKK